MKLRIKGNSLRLRLTQSEVAGLLSQGEWIESMPWGLESGFAYGIRLHDGELTLIGENGSMLVLLPETMAQTWGTGQEVGITGEVDFGNSNTRILIEKDWNCLAPRVEDADDAFPHPRQGTDKC